MSIRNADMGTTPSRSHDDSESEIQLTIGDVYEGDPLDALIPPEVVVMPKEGKFIFKEVDPDAGTWISARKTINLEDAR